jgi:hypothetical protein
MPTDVTFITEPTNLDYLMPNVRVEIGDFTGTVFSDEMVRTSLTYGIMYLQSKWASKYQAFWDRIVIEPQPDDVPAGFVYANTTHGRAYIPSGLAQGSAFRNPFLEFQQDSPPTIQSEDEGIIIIAATYLLRGSQYSSSASAFVSWSTEDIRYSNLGSERGLTALMLRDANAIDAYFRKGIGKAQISAFPLVIVKEQLFYE